MAIDRAISEFLVRHRLPESYSNTIQNWFNPVCKDIAAHQKRACAPLIVGINGCQGSGKTTMAAALVMLMREIYGLQALTISIDDFYLTRAERLQLSKNIHPLLATRGVPGTHDVQLAINTLQKLINSNTEVLVPRFNKANDDRFPMEQWVKVNPPVDIIILEGWCIAAAAQNQTALIDPINSLESNEDKQGQWREYVNNQLATQYPALFELFEILIMLKAPSFDCVYQWRLEQEQKLASTHKDTPSFIMDANEVNHFIQFFQRVTQHCLHQLPKSVHYLFELNNDRKIVNCQQPCAVT